MNGDFACICGDEEGIWCYSDECPNRAFGLRIMELNQRRADERAAHEGGTA